MVNADDFRNGHGFLAAGMANIRRLIPKFNASCVFPFSTNRSPSPAARTSSPSATPWPWPGIARRLGYERFWVSEHHNHPTIVGTAPEIVMAAIAATTDRIRIGSAGIMLPHYAPFKVAEVFRVLDALAPGRIDMGLGRAPGSDGRTAFALNPAANERPEHFPVRRARPDGLGAERAAGRTAIPSPSLKAFPQGATSPEVWILGSSDYGAQVAALFGLPYCYAWFFCDGAGGERAIDLYKRTYRPSARHPTPHSALCVWALAASTMEEAQYHFTSRALSRINRDKGVLGPAGDARRSRRRAAGAARPGAHRDSSARTPSSAPAPTS